MFSMEGLLQVEEAEGYDHLLQLYRAHYEENYFQYEERYDLSALHDEYFERWCRAETGSRLLMRE